MSGLAGNLNQGHTTDIHPDSAPTNDEKARISTSIGHNNIIKAMLLPCYLLYQELYILQFLHTAGLVGQD